MPTPPEMPVVAEEADGCGAGMIDLTRVQAVLFCSRCGQPRVRVTGQLDMLALTLTGLAGGLAALENG